MEKVITNPDGTTSVVRVVVNADGTETESVVSTSNPRVATKVVSTTPVRSADVIAKIPPFVSADKTQKFYQYKNANGKIVHAMYVNPTQVIEYYPNRSVTNLVVTDKSPLVSLVDVTSITDKSGKSVATVHFDSSILASSKIYWSTAPFAITLGIPNNIVSPAGALVVSSDVFAFNHDVEIYDLNAGTTYSFAIVTTDEAGNQNVTATDHFVTQGLLNY